MANIHVGTFLYILLVGEILFFLKYTRITTTTNVCLVGKQQEKGEHMVYKKKAQCYYYFYMEYKCILIHRSQSEYEKYKVFPCILYTVYTLVEVSIEG